MKNKERYDACQRTQDKENGSSVGWIQIKYSIGQTIINMVKGFIRALSEYGRLQKHTRRTRYKGMKNWLIPCEGSNKDPVELESNDG